MVLSGKYKVIPGAPIDPNALVDYWREVFTQASLNDQRIPEPKRDMRWDIIAPIEIPEIQRALRRLHDASPGLDGCTK